MRKKIPGPKPGDLLFYIMRMKFAFLGGDYFKVPVPSAFSSMVVLLLVNSWPP